MKGGGISCKGAASAVQCMCQPHAQSSAAVAPQPRALDLDEASSLAGEPTELRTSLTTKGFVEKLARGGADGATYMPETVPAELETCLKQDTDLRAANSPLAAAQTAGCMPRLCRNTQSFPGSESVLLSCSHSPRWPRRSTSRCRVSAVTNTQTIPVSRKPHTLSALSREPIHSLALGGGAAAAA